MDATSRQNKSKRELNFESGEQSARLLQTEAKRASESRSMPRSSRKGETSPALQATVAKRHGAPISARNAAQPDPLRQNTAFGTAEHPKGFAQTWRIATHTWRWRAVLCLFMSLLLTMMQPTGNALYRSWNAETGEVMGLAFAVDTATGANTSTDEPSGDDSSIVDVTTSSAANVNYNITTGKTDLVGISNPSFTTASSNEPAEEIALSTASLEDEAIKLEEGNAVIYHSTPSSAPTFSAWADATDQGLVAQVSVKMDDGTTLNPVDVRNIYSTNYPIALRWLLSGDNTKTYGDVGDPSEANGKMGAITVIDSKNGSVTSGDTSWTTTLEFDASGNAISPTSPWWALGYTPRFWLFVKPDNMQRTSKIIPESVYNEKKTGFIESDLTPVYGPVVNYESRITPRGSDESLTLNSTAVQYAQVGYNTNAYANYEKSRYSVQPGVVKSGVFIPLGNAISVIAADNDVRYLNWDTEITISGDDSTLKLLTEGTLGKTVNWTTVGVDAENRVRSGIPEVGHSGPTGSIWEFVNPDLSTDAKRDPRFPGGYFDSDGNGVIRVAAAFAETYLSNSAYNESYVKYSYVSVPEGGSYSVDAKKFWNYADSVYPSSWGDKWDTLWDEDPLPDGCLDEYIEACIETGGPKAGLTKTEFEKELETAGVLVAGSGDVAISAQGVNAPAFGESGANFTRPENATVSGATQKFFFAGWSESADEPFNMTSETVTFDSEDSTLAAAALTAGEGKGYAQPGGSTGTLSSSKTYYAVYAYVQDGEVQEPVDITLTDADGTLVLKDGQTDVINAASIKIDDVDYGTAYSDIKFKITDNEGTKTYTYDPNGDYAVKDLVPTATDSAAKKSSGTWTGENIDEEGVATLADTSAQATKEATLTFAHDTATYSVTLTTGADTNGKLGYASEAAGVVIDDTVSIQVDDVPYGTAYKDIRFSKGETDGSYIYDPDGVYSPDGYSVTTGEEPNQETVDYPGLTKTGRSSQYANTGNWYIGDAQATMTNTVAAATTLTFKFDTATYPVELAVGTNDATGTATATGRFASSNFTNGMPTTIYEVPYGTELAAITYKWDADYDANGDGTAKGQYVFYVKQGESDKTAIYSLASGDAVGETGSVKLSADDKSILFDGTSAGGGTYATGLLGAKPASSENGWTGKWTYGEWDASLDEGEGGYDSKGGITGKTVGGKTKMTFTYDVGQVAIVYNKANVKKGGASSDTDYKDLSDSTLTAVAFTVSDVDYAGAVATTDNNLSASLPSDVVSANLSDNYEIVYVPWGTASADLSAKTASAVDGSKFPRLSFNEALGASKYDANGATKTVTWKYNATTSGNSAEINEANTYPAFFTERAYVYDGTFKLKEFSVDLQLVAYDGGSNLTTVGKMRVKNSGSAYANPLTVTSDKTLEWGDYASAVITDEYLASLEFDFTDNPGYAEPPTDTPSSLTWIVSETASDPASTEVTKSGTTLSLEASVQTYTVTVTVNNGTLNSDSSFTISGVPYNKPLDGITYTKAVSGTAHAYSGKDADGVNVFSLDGQTSVKSPASSSYTAKKASWTWKVGDADAVTSTAYWSESDKYSDGASREDEPKLGGAGVTANTSITYDFNRTYTVTWVNWDGTTLETDTGVASGTQPSYDGATPERAESAEYTYAFAGWTGGSVSSATPAESLPTVTDDVTYMAAFTPTTRTYTLTLTTSTGSFNSAVSGTEFSNVTNIQVQGVPYGTALGSISFDHKSTSGTTVTAEYNKGGEGTFTLGNVGKAGGTGHANTGNWKQTDSSTANNLNLSSETVTGDKTVYYVFDVSKHNVTVAITGGTLNGDATFTISDVPYDTALNAITYTKGDGAVRTYSGETANNTTVFSLANGALSRSNGYSDNGTPWGWQVGESAAVSSQTSLGSDKVTADASVTYNYTQDSYTVTYEIVGGTWAGSTKTQETGFTYGQTIPETIQTDAQKTPASLAINAGATDAGTYAELTPNDGFFKTDANGVKYFKGAWYTRTGTEGNYTYTPLPTEDNNKPAGRAVTGNVTYVYVLSPVYTVNWKKAVGRSDSSAAVEDIRTDYLYGANVAGTASGEVLAEPSVDTSGDYDDRGWYSGAVSDTTSGAVAGTLTGTAATDAVTYTRYLKAQQVTYYILPYFQTVSGARSLADGGNDDGYAEGEAQSYNNLYAGETMDANTLKTLVQDWAESGKFTYAGHVAKATAAASGSGTTFAEVDDSDKTVALDDLSFTPEANGDTLVVYFTRDKHEVSYEYTYDGATTRGTDFNSLSTTDLAGTTKDYFYGEDISLVSVTDQAATGFVWGGWKVNGSGSAVTSATMDTDPIAYKGDWTVTPVQVTVHNADSTHGSVNSSDAADITVTKHYGETVTSSDFATAGKTVSGKRWAFLGWFDGAADNATQSALPSNSLNTTNYSTMQFDSTNRVYTFDTGLYAHWGQCFVVIYQSGTDGTLSTWTSGTSLEATSTMPAYGGATETNARSTNQSTIQNSGKPGYTFTGWTWTILDGEGNTSAGSWLLSNPPTDTASDLPFTGSVPGDVTFTSTYEGTPHDLLQAIDGNAQIGWTTNGGMTLTDYAKTKSTNVLVTDGTARTGDTVQLPTANQLKKTGYTLKGFDVVQAASAEGTSEVTYGTNGRLLPGAEFKVLAGNDPYTTALRITPIFEANTYNVTYELAGVTTAYTLGTATGSNGVTKPNVSGAAGTFTYAQNSDYTLTDMSEAGSYKVTGHTFKGYKATYRDADDNTQELEITDGKIAAANLPAANVTITATWEVKTFPISWQLADDYASDYGTGKLGWTTELNTNNSEGVVSIDSSVNGVSGASSPTSVQYGTPYAALANYAPTLSVGSNVDTKYSGSVTWSPLMTGSTTVTTAVPFKATPATKSYSVKVAVTSGTGHLSHDNNTSSDGVSQTFNNNTSYGTSVKQATDSRGVAVSQLTVHPESTDYVDTPTWTRQVSTDGSTWSDPETISYGPMDANNTDTVEGSVIYTATFAKKSYDIEYVLATWNGSAYETLPLDSGDTMLADSLVTTANSGDTITVASLPGLTSKAATPMTAAELAAKYASLTWYDKNHVAITAGTTKYSDSIAADKSGDGTPDTITLYAYTSVQNKTVNVSVSGGTVKSGDAAASDSFKNESVAYGTALKDVVNSTSMLTYAAGTGHSKDPSQAVWSGTVVNPNGGTTTVSATGVTGLDASTTPVTGTTNLTLTFPRMQKVTYRVANGAWGSTSGGTDKDDVVYWVPYGKKLNEYYVTDIDATASAGTLSATPAVGGSPDTGYAAGSWTAKVGDGDPAAVTIADSLSAPVTADVVYTYTYAPRNDLEVRVDVYRQHDKTPASGAFTESDYGNEGEPDEQVYVSNLTFGTQLDATYIAGLLGTIGDAATAGTVTVPVGFKRALANHSDSSEATDNVTDGVKSDTALQVQAETRSNISHNVIKVYLDRYSVDYTYQFTDAPDGFAQGPTTPDKARYGETKTLWSRDTAFNGKSFYGWKIDGEGEVVTSHEFTPDPVTEGDYTSFKLTSFFGEWVEALYSVTYRLLTEEERTALNGKQLGDVTFVPGEYDTTATLDPTARNVPAGAAPDSEVTLANDAQYEVCGWLYSIDGGENWVMRDTDSDDVPDAYVVVDSPSKVNVGADGFVFAPIIQLRAYTVRFTAGAYGLDLTDGDDGVEGVTTFTLKYGDDLPASPWVDAAEPAAGYNGEGTPSGNGQLTAEYAQTLNLTEKGFVKLDANYLYEFKATTETDNGNRGNWTTADTAKIVNDGKVGGDITYTWRFPAQVYEVYFMNIAGSNLSDAVTDTTAHQNTYTKVVNGQTALHWTGDWQGRDVSVGSPDSTAKTDINYTDSIFLNMGKDTLLSTVTSTLSNESTIAAYLQPTKPGATFTGWVKGSSTAAANATPNAAGANLSVSDIFNANYEGDEGKTQAVYAWATWDYDDVTLTYHNNVTNAHVTTSSPNRFYANAGLNMDSIVSEASAYHGGAADSLSAYDTVTLESHDSLGDAFTPAGYTFLGWSTKPYSATSESDARANLIADGSSFTLGSGDADLYAVYRANTYKVRWTDFNNNSITVGQVTSAGIASAGDSVYTGNAQEFTQEFTYNKAKSLTAMSPIFSNAGQKATVNPAGKTFKEWVYGEVTYVNGAFSGSATVSDGYNASRLTPVDGATITLQPAALPQYTLTVVYNNGDDNGSVTKDAITDSEDPHVGYAEFDLSTLTPSRTGYELDGWTIDGTSYGKGDKVYLNKNATAEAVWKASVANYTVRRHYPQKSDTSKEYVISSTESGLAGASSAISTTQAGTFKAADMVAMAADATTYPDVAPATAYSYAAGSTKYSSTEIAADGSTTIDLYYTLTTYKVTYKYTGSGVSGYAPSPASETVLAGQSVTLPGATTLPAGYAPTSDTWRRLATINGVRQYINAGNIGDEYTPDSNVTLYLSIGAAKYTVTFAVDGTTAKWSNGDASTVVSAQSGISKGTYPIERQVPATQEATGDTVNAYELIWTSSVTGTAANPFTTPVTSNVTYTASYKKINVVEYALGEHAYTSAGEGSKTSFVALPNPFMWDAATLVLEPSDLLTAQGTIKPEDGWAFVDWTDELGNHYASTSDIYAIPSPSKNYTFTANYTETEQQVAFTATQAGHAKADSTAYVWGYTGKTVSAAKPASVTDKTSYLADGAALIAPPAPDAQTGYHFAGWKGTFDGKEVTLQGGDEFNMPATDAELTAVFEPDEVTIAFKAVTDAMGQLHTYATASGETEGTLVSSNSVTTEALSTSTYTSKATPNPGYKLVGWSAADTTLDISSWYATTKQVEVDDGEGGTTVKTVPLEKEDTDYGLLKVARGSDGLYHDGTYTATFEPDPYKVTFVSSDDTKLTVTAKYYDNLGYQEVQRGTKIDLTSGLTGSNGNSVVVTPKSAGYSFSYWSYTMTEEYLDNGVFKTREVSSTTTDPTKVDVLGDTVFTAQYSVNEGSLMFVSNSSGQAGGSVAGFTSKLAGEEVTLPANGFTWTGHEFLGWSLDQNATATSGTLYQPGTKYKLAGGAEVMYAIWSTNQVNIVYHNGAVAADVNQFTSGSPADSTDADLRAAQYFVADVSATVPVSAATAVAAADADVWSTYAGDDINAALAGYTSWMTDGWDGVPGYIRNEAEKTRVPGYARTLKGWATEPGGAVVYAKGSTIPASKVPTGETRTVDQTEVTDNRLDLYAVWEDTAFTVSFNGGGGSTISTAATSDITGVTYGASVTVPALNTMYKYNEHTFTGWSDNATPAAVRVAAFGQEDANASSEYIFKSKTNVTLSATWKVNDGVTANVKVVFHPVNYSAADWAASSNAYSQQTRASMPMADGKHEVTDDYYTFEGWYIAQPATGAAPDQAFKDAYRIDGPANEKTVEDLLKKYYDGSVPGLTQYWDPSANEGEGNWTYAYTSAGEAADAITIDVYGWADLKRYDVNFNANAPDSVTDNAVDGSMDTQYLWYNHTSDQALNKNDFKVLGYQFAGWLQSTSAPGYAIDNGSTTVTGLLSDKYTVEAGSNLLGASAANTGTKSVNLHAIWHETETNTVTYHLTYDGDGTDSKGVTGYTSSKLGGFTWRTGDVPGGNATIVYAYDDAYSTAKATGENGVQYKVASLTNEKFTYTGDAVPVTASSIEAYPEPGVSAADKKYANYSFVDWYTEPGGPEGGGVKVEVGTDTVKDVVLRALAKDPNALTAKADGSYDLQLYAYWDASGARVSYNRNGATGSDLADTVAALGSDPTGTTTVALRTNAFTKLGYKPNGWNINSDNADDVGATTHFVGTYPFENRRTGETQQLFAQFDHRLYTVEFEYGGADVKGKIGENEIEGLGVGYTLNGGATTLQWGDEDDYSGYKVWPSNMSDPVKEGYSFGGYTTTYQNGSGETETINVAKGWTVEQLAVAIARAKYPTDAAAVAAAKADDVRGTADAAADSDKSYVLTAVWTPNTYTVAYDLGGASMADGSNPTKNAVTWATKDLLIDEANMTNPGYSNVTWYVQYDDNGTLKEELITEADPTLAQVADHWHNLAGAEATFPPTITLHAKWSESTVPIVFTASDTSVAKVVATVDGVETEPATQLVYYVGTASGDVYVENNAGDKVATGHKLSEYTITAKPDSGRAIAGWFLNGTGSDLTGSGAADFAIATFNGTGQYIRATYVAKVTGASVGYTVTHHYQAADGSWPDDADVTEGSADGWVAQSTGTANADSTLSRASLAADRVGFTLDESGAGLTITTDADANTIDLFYNRDRNDLSFSVVAEDGTVTPAAPALRENVYYGSTQALPGSDDALAANAADKLPTAPDGFKFLGWYSGYKNADDRGILVADADHVADASVTMPADDLELTAVYVKGSYKVKVSGVMYETESGTYAYTDVNDASISPVAGAETEVEVAAGATLDDDYNVKLLAHLPSSGTDEVTLGGGDTTLATVDHSYNLYVSWMITDYDGAVLGYTSDPTAEAITCNTVFVAVVSMAPTVIYLPGDHGVFATAKSAGTRYEDVVAEDETTFDLSGFPYRGVLTDNVNSANNGLPAGEDGWKFKGWYVKYVTALGNIYDSSEAGLVYTEETIRDTGNFAAMSTSITLTAAWEPTESTLTFDLNAPDMGGTAVAFNEGKDPSDKYVTGTKVRLPQTNDTTADGYTLSKWVWTTTNASGNAVTYEYAPGTTTFEMPGRLLNAETTLTAVWVEDYATITYASADLEEGTVSNASEQIGVWTGYPKGAASGTAAGSKATPVNSNYTFAQWTTLDAEGNEVVVSTAADGTISANQLVKGADGKYASAAYTASFTGVDCVVQFLVSSDSTTSLTSSGWMGYVFGSNDQNQISGGFLRTTTPYGAPVDQSTHFYAVPEDGFQLADGNCWDYVMYDGTDTTTANIVKQGSVSDEGLKELDIVAPYTVLTVHFQIDEGAYVVKWLGRNTGADSLDTVTFTSRSAWNDVVEPTRTITRTGYQQNGWYTDIPGSTAKGVDEPDYEAEPGNTKLNGQTYGTLAGGTLASSESKESITMRAGWTMRRDFEVKFYDNAVDASRGKAEQSWTVSDVAWTGQVDATAYTNTVSADDHLLGYEFAGWYTKRVGGERVDVDDNGLIPAYNELVGGDDSIGSVPLYAHWTPITYYVYYTSSWGYSDETQYGYNYVHSYTIDQTSPSLNISSPPNSDENWTWDGWKYTSGNTSVAVDSSTTVRTLLAANASRATVRVDDNGNYLPGDTGGQLVDCFVIDGEWLGKLRWTTTYVLYQWDEASSTWVRDDSDLATSLSRKFADDLTDTFYDWANADVRPDFNRTVPGFKFDNDAEAITIGLYPGASGLADVKGKLAVDPAREGWSTTAFEVAVVPKAPYYLSFDLNDSGSYTDLGYTHAATITDYDGVAVVDLSTLDQKDKTYFSIENTPHLVDANGKAVLDEYGYDYYNDPTRPGFKFDGWWNVAIEDASGAGSAAVAKGTAVESLGGMDTTSDEEETLYGDLARDEDGKWVEANTENPEFVKLYARWTELTHQVFYSVASDQIDLVKIRLNSETDDDYDTKQRSEIIGAATGDRFEALVDGDTVTYDRKSGVSQGAVAQVPRGYHAVWRIVSSADDEGATSFDMPLGVGNPYGSSALSTAVARAASVSLSTSAAVQADAILRTTGVSADDPAGIDGVILATAADDDTSLDGTTATSTQGQRWQAVESITPGVRTDDGSNLFVGDPTDSDETGTTSIMYVATAELNDDASITINPDGGTYSGDTTIKQPYGTYIGEPAPYGRSEGALPAAGTITRDGYTFNGWIIPAGTQYVDADGVTQTFDVDTVVSPTDPIAGRIIVPQGGIALKASWTANPDGATYTVTVPETTLDDGTVLPGVTIQVKGGTKLTSDQIEQIINRDGKTVDKWIVSYDGWDSDRTVTTDELRTLLGGLTIEGNLVVKPSPDAKSETYVPPAPTGKDPTVRPASGSLTQTGDVLTAYLPVLVGVAVVAAALLLVLLALKRRKGDDA